MKNTAAQSSVIDASKRTLKRRITNNQRARQSNLGVIAVEKWREPHWKDHVVIGMDINKREKVSHIKQCHRRKEIMNIESTFDKIYHLHLSNVILIISGFWYFDGFLFRIQDSLDVFSVISRKKEIKETFDLKSAEMMEKDRFRMRLTYFC